MSEEEEESLVAAFSLAAEILSTMESVLLSMASAASSAIVLVAAASAAVAVAEAEGAGAGAVLSLPVETEPGDAEKDFFGAKRDGGRKGERVMHVVPNRK